MPPKSVKNEAAARLLARLDGTAKRHALHYVPRALAAERRATVERIRERAHRDGCSPPCLTFVKGDAILDEEAARV